MNPPRANPFLAHYSCFLLFILFVAGPMVSAEQRLTMSLGTGQGESEQIYRRNLFSDLKYVYTAPFHWNRKQLLTAVGITAGAAAIYHYDAGIMNWVQSLRSRTTRSIAFVAEKFGNYKFVIPGMALLFGYGKLFNDQRAENIALLAAKSAVATQLVVHLFKLAGHRHRPNAGNGPRRWDGPSLKSENLSFCSGHSAMAFTLASVIATRLKTTTSGILAYGAATLTALSRVHDRKHWASDVVVGSVIGYVIGRAIARRKAPNGEHKFRETISIPLFVFPKAGISFGLRF